ncbi:MAG: desulfoferrodoxin [Planctomycetia bacterium]|nr:desulfoferrodoxin [Planctomycetia bacterium]
MAEKFQVWKCPICGNVVEVISAGDGELVCCGQPMELLKPGSTDGAVEKHVPVFHKDGCSVKITVGSVSHPMTADHYIEWIEIHTEGRSQRKYLKPGDTPEAEFSCPPGLCQTGVAPHVLAYCNLHGLWECKPDV